MADTAYWYCYLNTPSDREVLEFILHQFESMWVKYNDAAEVQAVGHVDEDVIHKWSDNIFSRSRYGHLGRAVEEDILEIAYEDLIGSPLPALQSIYEHVGVEWTERVAEHFAEEEVALRKYRTNTHVQLHPEVKAVLRNRWGDFYRAFGYE
jgi:omega-hydroxy-beta-dihydromenaquinone-9 sulfotransferase